MNEFDGKIVTYDICPDCGAENYPSAKRCCECGVEYLETRNDWTGISGDKVNRPPIVEHENRWDMKCPQCGAIGPDLDYEIVDNHVEWSCWECGNDWTTPRNVR